MKIELDLSFNEVMALALALESRVESLEAQIEDVDSWDFYRRNVRRQQLGFTKTVQDKVEKERIFTTEVV